jgi:ATP-binding cassette, subfamily D (ALD), member 3
MAPLMRVTQGASFLTFPFLWLQQYPQFARLLMVFAGVAVPAACVNSGLKYFQKRIQLTFMRRLTHNLHQQYTANRAYYAASTLGGAHT